MEMWSENLETECDQKTLKFNWNVMRKHGNSMEMWWENLEGKSWGARDFISEENPTGAPSVEHTIMQKKG